MQPLHDIREVPLDRPVLIEASAGTGKTFSIVNLYLRFLVEGEGVPLPRLLVVTFTEAATGELRDRLRHNLVEARQILAACAKAGWSAAAADPVAAILHSATASCGRKVVAARLERALLCFDEAAIFTIHGFCARMLADFAFLGDFDADLEIAPDDRERLRETVEDFWRRQVYGKPRFFTALLTDCKIAPETLVELARSALAGGRRELRPESSTPSDHAEREIGRCWQNLRVLCTPGIAEKAGGIRIQAALELLLAHAGDDEPGEFLFAAIGTLTDRGEVRKSVAKKHPELAAALADLAKAVEDFAISFRQRFLKWLFDEQPLRQRQRAAGLRSYQDLLETLREQLADPDSGRRLAGLIRRRFPAAMIDEFQDTDAIQYEIFKGLFLDCYRQANPHSLILVGDPKQAIYAFRGGDIYMYRQARQDVMQNQGSLFYLDTNWRSSAGLLEAINWLFEEPSRSNSSFCRPPRFACDFIRYEPIEPAPNADRIGFADADRKETAPCLTLWAEPAETAEDPEGRAAETVAAAILGLLSDPGSPAARVKVKEPGWRPLAPGDLAILVEEHRQARMVQEKLMARGVPAAVQSAGSVFATGEAEELLRLLDAILDPGDGERMRAALATELGGWSMQDIFFSLAETVETTPAEVRHTIEQARRKYENACLGFAACHRLWRDHSFIRMFQELMTRESASARLLRRCGGERRLTNFRHLAEILHRAMVEQGFAPATLRTWLERQIADEGKHGEEYEIQLESDAEAVKIMTVFKSKGLEFPVVFCPFLWRRDLTRLKPRGWLEYHDPKLEWRPVIDLTDGEPGARLQRGENLAERMRLVYVALTRACCKVYLQFSEDLASSPGRTRVSALDYFLFAAAPEDDCENAEAQAAAETTDPDWLTSTRTKLAGLGVSGRRRELEQFAHRAAAHCVEVAPPPAAAPGSRLRLSTLPSASELIPPPPPPSVEGSWRLHSFSSLIAKAETLQSDLSSAVGGKDDEMEPPVAAPRESPLTRYNFPGGVRTGNCLHGIFEKIDFAARQTEIENQTRDALRRFGLDGVDPESRCQVAAEMVRDTLRRPLQTAFGTSFALADIPPADRVSELAFTFSLPERPQLAAGEIWRLLDSWGGVYARPGGAAFADSAKARKQRMRGLMNGFVDLVVRHRSRYYIVDWKTNRLGGRPEDFAMPDNPARDADTGLPRAIRDAGYALQWMIYTVALHRHLQRTLPDYRYETHFGGVFYLFVRGIEPDGRRGVFAARPEWRQSADLGRLLTPHN